MPRSFYAVHGYSGGALVSLMSWASKIKALAQQAPTWRCLEIDGEVFGGVDGSDPEPVVASLLRDLQQMMEGRPA